MSDAIIGIDFGTTSSAVATIDSGVPSIISDSAGREFLPSSAFVRGDGEIFVGHEAVRESRKCLGSGFNVGSIKRLMDRKMAFRGLEKGVSPLILSSLILAELRFIAESHLKQSINKVVITVPANFGYFQRQFVKEASLIAGLEPVMIVNEATAAVCMLRNDFEGVVTAADLGGGSFDLSIVEVGEGVNEVVYANGDDELGGDDFTETLIRVISDKTRETFDLDLCRSDPSMHYRIGEAAEEAKILLSGSKAVEVRIPLLKNRKGGDENLACSITQAEFEIECEPLLSRIRTMVGEALSFEDARSRRMSTSLIQGSRKRDETWMGRLLGAIKGGSTSRHSKSVGLSSNERLSIWLLGNASRMPAISRELRGSWQVKPASLAGVKSPVALGAARLGGMRSGVDRQLLLLDVTSRSLGTSTAKDPFIPLIERNTTFPTKKTSTFTTVADNQPSIEVPILEQNPRPGGGCRIIDVLRLDGIPPCVAGTPKIEVSFDVDGNGILDVSAKNLTTGHLVNVRYDKLQSTPSTINQYHGLVQEWLAKRRERR